MARHLNFLQRLFCMRPFHILGMAIIIAALTCGCTGHIRPEPDSGERLKRIHSQDAPFVIIRATSADTPAGLAETYLGDSRRAWQILEFNQIESLKPGRRIVIPLQPVNPGGLTAQEYQTVPILTYTNPGTAKGVTANRQDAAQLSMSQLGAFENQMYYLYENGFTTAAMEQLLLFLQFRDSLPPKAIILAFRTESRWFYEQVWPVLQSYGFTATLFISPPAVGKPAAMDWKQIEELAATGIDIGIRTDHMDIGQDEQPGQYHRKIEKTLMQAKEYLSTQPVVTGPYFSYPPDCEADDLKIAMLKKYGYQLALTDETGENPFFAHAFKLRQHQVDFEMDAAEFKTHTIVFHKTGLP